MEELCISGVCELSLRIQEFPQGNSAFITAGIASLAVIFSGAISAYVVFITSRQNNENARRNWMDPKLVEILGDVSAREFIDDDLEDLFRKIGSASLLISKDRSGGSDLFDHLEVSNFPNEGDLISWQSELKTVANIYFN